MSLFQQAKFLASFDVLARLATPHGKEIAFAASSNVGKSSTINVLANRIRGVGQLFSSLSKIGINEALPLSKHGLEGTPKIKNPRLKGNKPGAKRLK